MNLNNFLATQQTTIKEALESIGINNHGVIMIQNEVGAVVALATEGDIRRKLIEGITLDAPVSLCANETFIWADTETPREMLLKQLDQRIKVIPVLDQNKRLKGIVSRDFIPVLDEEPIYARARSPVRISFGGGGSDLTDFFAGGAGAVINTTISIFSHALLKKRSDGKIIIHSRDLGESLIAPDLQSAIKGNGKMGLFKSLLKAIHPEFGFELSVNSDFPPGSGLGGSAVVASAVLGCFNQFRQDKWDHHEIAELAFQAERLFLGISGGWQDQYATVFGGFNFMEFKLDQNIVNPLRIHPDVMAELEESLVLCDTGVTHNSGEIHSDQGANLQQEIFREKVHSSVELTYRMRNHLLRGRLLEFGKCIHEAWTIKRGLSSKISNSRFDEIYNGAIANGALGGKLLGAGGGGFFLFYVPPFLKFQLMDYLSGQGLKLQNFKFEQEGLRAWTGREHKTFMETTAK